MNIELFFEFFNAILAAICLLLGLVAFKMTRGGMLARMFTFVGIGFLCYTAFEIIHGLEHVYPSIDIPILKEFLETGALVAFLAALLIFLESARSPKKDS